MTCGSVKDNILSLVLYKDIPAAVPLSEEKQAVENTDLKIVRMQKLLEETQAKLQETVAKLEKTEQDNAQIQQQLTLAQKEVVDLTVQSQHLRQGLDDTNRCWRIDREKMGQEIRGFIQEMGCGLSLNIADEQAKLTKVSNNEERRYHTGRKEAFDLGSQFVDGIIGHFLGRYWGSYTEYYEWLKRKNGGVAPW